MPDLDATLHELSRLSERPPADPPPLEQLAGRARTIRRRRTTLKTTPIVAVVAFLGVVALGGFGNDDDLGKVAVEPQPPTTSTTVPPTGSTAESGMQVVPHAGLADGDQVVVKVDDTEGPLVAVQCGSTSFGAGGSRLCDGMTFQSIRADGTESTQPFEVRRYVHTSGGFVDCTEEAGRCHLLVAHSTLEEWDEWHERDDWEAWNELSSRSAPLTFDPARAVDPTIELRDGLLANGDVTVISGRHFPAGHEVWIGQCLPGVTADDVVERCDSLRNSYVTTTADGRFQVKFQVSQDIRLWQDESWTPCLDCEIVVRAGGLRYMRAPVEITSDGQPIRPAFEILEDGPYTPGQEVTLVGTGFQNGFPPQPGWCMLNTDEPYPSCGYPDESFHPVQSQIDTFTFPSFPMPRGAHADLCLAFPESDCAIAWVRGDGTPPTAILRYEMVPE